ncbi:LLM class flavin-dependent oxidoreductase [Robiginitomaculum antarcticum]|uniref:LLM class flavin-dependent oxidoreductase n=1 Tax=Robiginitomaculum antarcticum TaxID=437507 RepID=UPI00037F175D|nr:LLM class flavin-dependent oxidoreductase [Robiginitomaculum antarcticum]
MTIPFSILDLARVTEGHTIAQSFDDCVSTAQKAEQLGYKRVWYAEHHNMVSVASSATSVLIAHIATQTKTIRVGSGGVMLPNHSPLTIAEQFGTLATLHPGRIDLGLGRAPGGDRNVIRALRKDAQKAANRFPQDVMELLSYLDEPGGQLNDTGVRAIPGEGTQVPVWILGSSLFGAQLAAHLGLPYAFASHFAPQHVLEAAQTYRRDFKPSKYLDKPYFMMACNVFAADTEEEAQFHFTTLLQAFIGIITNQRGLIPAPVENFEVPAELGPHLESMLQCSAVGTAEQVAEQLSQFQRELSPDEYIISMPFYDQAARLKSMELTMGIRETLGA